MYDGRGDGKQKMAIEDDGAEAGEVIEYDFEEEDEMEERRRLVASAPGAVRAARDGRAPRDERSRRRRRRLEAVASARFVQYAQREGPLSQLVLPAIEWAVGAEEGCPMPSADESAADEVCALEDVWFEQWHSDIENWWLLTPYREGLQACMGALGLHLASRFEAAQRAWLALQGKTPPPTRAHPTASEPGCSWVSESASQLEIPKFPEWPTGPDAFEMPLLPPIPRLLPNVLSSGGLHSALPLTNPTLSARNPHGGEVAGEVAGEVEERPSRAQNASTGSVSGSDWMGEREFARHLAHEWLCSSLSFWQCCLCVVWTCAMQERISCPVERAPTREARRRFFLAQTQSEIRGKRFRAQDGQSGKGPRQELDSSRPQAVPWERSAGDGMRRRG